MNGESTNDRKTLDDRIVRLQIGLEIAGAIVVFGLLVEYGPEFVDSFRNLRIPSRNAIGGLLITLGVAAEVLCGIFIARYAKQAQEFADLDIARALERAAVAEKEAAEANLARLKIEARFADRVLNDPQLASLIEKIKPFAGQEYDANTYWDSREPLALAERISVALNWAGWKLIHVVGQTMLPEKTGVLVYVHVEAQEETKKAAIVLVSALNAEGIATELRRWDKTHPKNNKVEISVGTKPQ